MYLEIRDLDHVEARGGGWASKMRPTQEVHAHRQGANASGRQLQCEVEETWQ